MKFEYFIAHRLIRDKEIKHNISRPILKISVIAIAFSLFVMLISVAVVIGFKKEIKNKVSGFGSHIQIVNYDLNNSFETSPISKNQSFLAELGNIKQIEHIQTFATKPGIIKTKSEIEGAIVKGVSTDYNWSFFKENLVQGYLPSLNDSVMSTDVLISDNFSNSLKLNVDDEFAMFFIEQQKPRPKRLKVAGIFNTSLEEFDNQFLIGDIKLIQDIKLWEDSQISGFEVLLKKFKNIDNIKPVISEIVGTNYYNNESILQVRSIRDMYPPIFDWLELIDINVLVLLIIMVFVAAVCMSSGLLIMILDRIRMIGTLKALGSENSMIRNIFMYNSAFLIFRGLFWGNLFGILFCIIQEKFKLLSLNAEFYFMEYVPIDFNVLYILLINIGTLLLIMGVLLIPALIISRISPAKTIRFN